MKRLLHSHRHLLQCGAPLADGEHYRLRPRTDAGGDNGVDLENPHT